jgi:hypothetical protein
MGSCLYHMLKRQKAYQWRLTSAYRSTLFTKQYGWQENSVIGIEGDFAASVWSKIKIRGKGNIFRNCKCVNLFFTCFFLLYTPVFVLLARQTCHKHGAFHEQFTKTLFEVCRNNIILKN